MRAEARLAAGVRVALLVLLVSSWPASAGFRFREVAEDWGLDFLHRHGGSGKRYMVETMVGGVVLFDFDQDGDVDVFFVDGGRLPGYEGEEPRSRLYRNEGAGRFVDATDAAGLGAGGYGSGAGAADHDGDGDLDLYVANFGPNLLYRNNGDGTFTEVGEEAGVDDPLWSIAGAFADTDRDGDLDLYVVNYVDFALERNIDCGDKLRDIPGYCHPGAYDGLPDRFYRNLGDGTFEEAGEATGLSGLSKAGLGVIVVDLDNDGWPDIYVANDADPNFVYHNRGDGTFEDVSLISGATYSDTGTVEAGMGVDSGDVDGDGLFDIVVTNFELETNALYKNIGHLLFTDGRFLTNIAEASLPNLGFGVALSDLDQDGDLDLVVANGHILDNAEVHAENSRFAQPNQLLENLGRGRFKEVVDHGMDVVRPGRGLATGDLDGDGDLDLVILNSGDIAEVYENVGAEGGWLQVDLRSAGGNHFGIGTRLELESGASVQLREARTSSSFASQNDLTLHFGVGEEELIDRLVVRWPDGRVQAYQGLPARRSVLLVEPALDVE